MSFSLLSNLVLTPASKLYKVGIFIENDPAQTNSANSDGWIAHLYDDQMSQADRQKAAVYFYDGFLGCVLPQDNAYRTKKFYDLTDAFISALPANPEVRSDLKTALYTYLKVDTSVNISVDDFADTFFASDPLVMTQYKTHMASNSFADASFVKDIQDLASVLKRRTLKFPSGTKITGSASSIDNFTIESGTGEDSSGRVFDQTTITIPEKLIGV